MMNTRPYKLVDELVSLEVYILHYEAYGAMMGIRATVNSDSKSQGRKKRDIFNCNNLAFS
jgi:hypothetical protein